MKIIKNLIVIISLLILSCLSRGADKHKHLFILTGQSNMKHINISKNFTPIIENEFGKENIVIYKYALGGKSIRHWDKSWPQKVGENFQDIGDVYDTLINNVLNLTAGLKFSSVTLVWMQGERDAFENNSKKYKNSLKRVIGQLEHDLSHENINVVIGRLNDFDMENKWYRDWTKIRKIQLNLSKSNDRYALVNTDDLNDGISLQGYYILNGLHMSRDGFDKLGERFAHQAINLILENQ